MLLILSPKSKRWTTDIRTRKNDLCYFTIGDVSCTGTMGLENVVAVFIFICFTLSTLMPMVNAIGVAIIIYNIRAELSKRE